MSLTYARTIAAGTGILDAASRGSGNELVVLLSGNTLRRYDMTTGSQVGSDISVSATAMGMITTNLVALTDFNNATSHIVNLTTGVVTNFTSMDFSLSSALPQTISAGDTSGNSFALGFTSSPTNTLMKFNSALTCSLLSPAWTGNSSRRPKCIVKSADADTYGSAIIGFDDGSITEIDASGNRIFEYTLAPPRSLVAFNTGVNVNYGIYRMHYARGYLIVSTYTGQVLLVDHYGGGNVLQAWGLSNAQASIGPLVSNEGGDFPIVCSSMFLSQAGMIMDFDPFLTPWQQQAQVVRASSSTPSHVGCDGSHAWEINSSNNIYIYFFTAPRTVSALAVNITSGSGEVFVMKDPGTATMMFHTSCGSVSGGGSRNVPVTNGLTNKLGLATFGDGTSQTYAVTRD